MNLPKRTLPHKTETESLALLRQHLGTDWMFRDHFDRDYGVDVHLELFDAETPTGLTLYGQVKGTNESFESNHKLRDFSTKTANYANLFAIPFFVFFTSITSKQTRFVWLQEYLRLNTKSKQLSQQDSITIDFPPENILTDSGNIKIKAILHKDRLKKASLMYITYYERLANGIESLKSGSPTAARLCLIQLLEIQRLALVSEATTERDIFGCNFNAAIQLLQSSMQRQSIYEADVKEIERIVHPLKFKKLELLNQDTQNAIDSWLTGSKHY